MTRDGDSLEKKFFTISEIKNDNNNNKKKTGGLKLNFRKTSNQGGDDGGGGKQQAVGFQWPSLKLPSPPPGTVQIGLFASVGMAPGVPALLTGGDDGQRQICRLKVATEQQVSLASSASPAASVSSQNFGFKHRVEIEEEEGEEDRKGGVKEKKKRGGGVRIRVSNDSLKRLLSGAFAGAISRTAVAPLETIRTHLMVGSSGKSMHEVFSHIMELEGWQGLFRGNGVNVLRVAPSKAIELFSYDTVKNFMTVSKVPLPISPVAGAVAGVCSTLCTYPLELLKTRMTVQRGVYDNLLHALSKIVKEEGFQELYRGLTPSLIGVVPYSATTYLAYETLRKGYKKVAKKDEIGNVAQLLIGAAAGAIGSTATFPLEVARKHMQVGALSGRQVYNSLFHALVDIFQREGLAGLYRGLGPSCMKLVPAAGISFMCYEATKRLLIEDYARKEKTESETKEL